MTYASGKKALGICDTCGLTWPLKRLRFETIAGRMVKLRVCPDCYDPDNPRDKPSRYTAKTEAIALRDPRPDTALATSNSLTGWAPVRGEELPVFPVADGWSQFNVEALAPRYLLTEDSLFRLVTETGDQIIWAERDGE